MQGIELDDYELPAGALPARHYSGQPTVTCPLCSTQLRYRWASFADVALAVHFLSDCTGSRKRQTYNDALQLARDLLADQPE